MAELKELIKEIYELMRNCPNGWVRWKDVAREIKGTEEYAIECSGLADLPDNKKYFVQTRNLNVVKLTEEGLELAREDDISPQPDSPNEVIKAIRKYAAGLEKIKLEVIQLHKIAETEDKFVYSVQIKVEDSFYTSDTPVKYISSNGGFADGKILGQETDGSMVYVAFDYELSYDMQDGHLSIEEGYLLNQLANGIIERTENVSNAIKALTNRDIRNISTIKSPDGTVIAEKLSTLPDGWTYFLWGPPGSGKTYTIAQLISLILKREPESRILLTAPSNLSVDVALEEVIEQLKKDHDLNQLVAERKLVRYGYPRKETILSNSAVLGPEDQDELSLEIKKIARKIARKERGNTSEEKISILRAQLLEKQEELKNSIDSHISQANVVATSSTQTHMSNSPIIMNKWDVVLLDEATMTPPAICVFLGALANKNFLLAGDPRQLGPVYKEDYRNPPPPISKKWMGTDIFERSGISSGQGVQRRIDENDSRLVRITCQRRCDYGIWKYVEHLYPRITRTSETNMFNNVNPVPGKALVLLDTSTNEQNPTLSKKCQRSRQNEYTAETAFEVASSIASESGIPKNSTIAIISPYRAQVQLIRKWIKGERKNGEVFKNVEVGTVHQFQGSAADVVIFDIVDGPGRPDGLGPLLKDDNGMRLVNVAITRARYKVIILAGKEWFRRSVNREDNPLLYNLILERPGDEEWPVIPAQPEVEYVTESPIEENLLNAMMANPSLSSVKTQVKIYSEDRRIISRADFAFEDIKLAIYCDGAQWHCKENQWRKDIRQRNKLSLEDWQYLVFTGREINNDSEKCADQIARKVSKMKQGR